MDPEIEEALNRLEKTTEENNKILKKLHRSMVWGRVFRVIYWVVLLGVAVGAVYFIQPYIEAVGSLVGLEFGDGNFLEFWRNFR